MCVLNLLGRDEEERCFCTVEKDAVKENACLFRLTVRLYHLGCDAEPAEFRSVPPLRFNRTPQMNDLRCVSIFVASYLYADN